MAAPVKALAMALAPLQNALGPTDGPCLVRK